MKNTLILLGVLALTACADGSKNPTDEPKTNEEKESQPSLEFTLEQEEMIHTSLENLLTDEDPDAFLVINENISGNFVQFAKVEGTILLDLPADQLRPEQLLNAEYVLGEYGIEPETQSMFDPDDPTKIIGEFTTFSKDLGEDIDLATEITRRLIMEVFNLTDPIEIVIEQD